LLYRISTQRPAPPRFAGTLAPLLGRLLASDPAGRPSMNEAADALALLAAGDETHLRGPDAGPAAPVAGPQPTEPGAPQPPPAKRPGPLIAAAGAVLGLAVATGIVLFGRSGDNDPQAADASTPPRSAPTSAAGTSESPAATDEDTPRVDEPSTSPAPEASAPAPEASAPVTSSPTAPPTTAAEASTAEASTAENAAEAPTAESGVGDLVVPASGTWILVLESMPQNEKSLPEAQAVANQLTVPGYDVVVVDSSTTSGLNGGYWAVSVVSFGSQDSAAAACASFSRAVGPTCYPRAIG
jgi:hypothetical protein